MSWKLTGVKESLRKLEIQDIRIPSLLENIIFVENNIRDIKGKFIQNIVPKFYLPITHM